MKKIVGILLVLSLLTGCTGRMANVEKSCEETKEMEVHYLDLEKGKCSFFKLPNGENMLIDAGISEDFPTIYEYLRNLEVNVIDYLIVSSNDETHLGGAKKIIQNFNVIEMFVSPRIQNSSLYKTTANEAVLNNCKIHIAEGGTEILNCDKLNISITSPIFETYENSADFALSAMISYGEVSFFSEGDCTQRSENDMVSAIGEYLDCNVVSLPNCGEGLTTSSDFLQKTTPEYAVIQVFGDRVPRQSMLDVLKTFSIYTLRTDVNGNIKITCNDSSITDIKTDR